MVDFDYFSESFLPEREISVLKRLFPTMSKNGFVRNLMGRNHPILHDYNEVFDFSDVDVGLSLEYLWDFVDGSRVGIHSWEHVYHAPHGKVILKEPEEIRERIFELDNSLGLPTSPHEIVEITPYAIEEHMESICQILKNRFFVNNNYLMRVKSDFYDCPFLPDYNESELELNSNDLPKIMLAHAQEHKMIGDRIPLGEFVSIVANGTYNYDGEALIHPYDMPGSNLHSLLSTCNLNHRFLQAFKGNLG